MTESDVEELISDCPRLFHMAERGSFESIRRHGLMSTTALLDLFQVQGARRSLLERCHRPRIEHLTHPVVGSAALRDQLPMSDEGLRRALPPEIAPADWYARLNGLVFFWLTEGRLHRLTGARAYRAHEHEVLVLDTRAVVREHHDAIWLCPINSGCTKPMPAPRDFGAFRRIEDYPYFAFKRRPRGERVVELCIDYALRDVDRFLLDAYVVRGEQRIASLP